MRNRTAKLSGRIWLIVGPQSPCVAAHSNYGPRVSFVGGVASKHDQFFTVRSFGGKETPTFRPVFHPEVSDGNLVAGLQGVSRPSAATQEIRAHSFKSPCVDAAIRVVYVEPDPGVGICPLEGLHGTADGPPRARVEHGESMVRSRATCSGDRPCEDHCR